MVGEKLPKGKETKKHNSTPAEAAKTNAKGDKKAPVNVKKPTC